MNNALAARLETVVNNYAHLVTMSSELFEHHPLQDENLSKQIQAFTNRFLSQVRPLLDEVGKMEVELIVEREMALNNMEAER
jgi:hypothetical protein